MSSFQSPTYCICTVPQALHTVHYSFMRLFKSFWNVERQRGGVCAVWYTTPALNPSLCVLYCIFMQSGVLWEEPELAVDLKGHRAVGMEILLTQSVQSYLFPLAREECLRLDSGNKPKQHDAIKYMCLCLTLLGDGTQTGFLPTLKYFLLRGTCAT